MFPTVCLLLLIAAETNPLDYKKSAGPAEVETMDLDWKDSKRDRDVPVRLYVPKGDGPFPIIIFSHGLGGSRQGYAYLGKHWASHGYVVVHLQHKGSDDSVWKESKQRLEAMRKAARDPANLRNRPLDVRFAIDQMEKLNKDGTLKGRLDLDRVGMAGHSFGAYTTLAAAGQTFFPLLGKPVSLGEPRIKAAIAMSPNAPARKTDLAKEFGSIKVPIFHLTGTRDDGVGITEAKPADRRVPYDNIKGAPQYLLIFKDGDHMVFAAARRRPGEGKKDALFHGLNRMSTTAFWDAHLKGDSKARDWLTGEFKKRLGAEGTFESKK
jgi:predicted dienelactone hydrolase